MSRFVSWAITYCIIRITLNLWLIFVNESEMYFFFFGKVLIIVKTILYIGEGNGTPLQHSCLENPIGGGAWWAAVHGVTKSRTRLSDFTFTFYFMQWRRKWQPTPVFLPGESQGWGSLVGCCLWGRTESDTTEATLQQQQQHQTIYTRWVD